jgi:hypothetical protein
LPWLWVAVCTTVSPARTDGGANTPVQSPNCLSGYAVSRRTVKAPRNDGKKPAPCPALLWVAVCATRVARRAGRMGSTVAGVNMAAAPGLPSTTALRYMGRVVTHDRVAGANGWRREHGCTRLQLTLPWLWVAVSRDRRR